MRDITFLDDDGISNQSWEIKYLEEWNDAKEMDHPTIWKRCNNRCKVRRGLNGLLPKMDIDTMAFPFQFFPTMTDEYPFVF